MSDQPLKQRIDDDMKSAMRAKESLRLSTLRLLKAAMKQFEIDQQTALDEAGVMSIINKMIKQRRESIKQFQEGNRPELAEKEQQEIDVLSDYLPPQLDENAISDAVQKAIASSDAKDIKDMGKVMGLLKGELAGKADMGLVSQKVKEALS